MELLERVTDRLRPQTWHLDEHCDSMRRSPRAGVQYSGSVKRAAASARKRVTRVGECGEATVSRTSETANVPFRARRSRRVQHTARRGPRPTQPKRAKREPAGRWWSRTVAMSILTVVGCLLCRALLLDPRNATRNPRYLFRVVTGHPAILAMVSLAALAAMLVIAHQNLRETGPAWSVGLVLGGSVSNAAERLATGFVADYIKGPGVVVNLADIAVLVGLLVASVLVLIAKSGGARADEA